MLVNRWNPISNLWGEMDRFRSEMNDLFNRFGTESGVRPPVCAYPPLNLWEDEANVYAEAELPGLALDKIAIYVTEGNQLTIQGERPPSETPPNAVWHRQERGHGKFNRVLTLPALVDADRVEARFENGVLRITLPKSAAARPRKITVQGD